MKKIKLLLLMVCCGTSVFCQLQQLKIVNFTVKNQLPPKIESWANVEDAISLTTLNQSKSKVNAVKLVIQLKENNEVVAGNSTKTAILTKISGTKKYASAELISLFRGLEVLRKGNYTVCARFYNEDNVSVSDEVCRNFTVKESLNSSEQNLQSAKSSVSTPASTFLLTIARSGLGSGTVSSAPAGIFCGSSCSASFTSGALVTLSATPASGSTFSGWTGACIGTGTCTVTMDAAKNVGASFAQITYPLTVSKSGSGTVTSSSGGIFCGSACADNYTDGSVVTLTATPASGSTFSGWSGACTGTGACTVTMDAAKNVGATFSTNYSLTVSKTGTGTGTVTSSAGAINCGASCADSYASGSVVTLTATPTAGSTFTGWTGACTGTGACALSMDAAKTVTANFTTIPTVDNNCTACNLVKLTLPVSTIMAFYTNNTFTLSQNITIAATPLKLVKSIKAELTYFEFTPDNDECLACNRNSALWGNLNTGTIAGVSGVGGVSRSLTFNYSPLKLPGSFPAMLNITLPPLVACCSGLLRYCIRYVFAFDDCTVCTKTVCYEKKKTGTAVVTDNPIPVIVNTQN